MMPNKETKFLNISELSNYTDEKDWCCISVVFSPETENNHFEGCPPYIQLFSNKDYETHLFFEVPQIVAYYAKTHPCYTMKGIENHIKQGEKKMAAKIKSLLDIQ